MDGQEGIPFGMLFAESCCQTADEPNVKYDEETDMSYFEDSKGRRNYVVECGDLAKVGTKTATKTFGEGTDEDPPDAPKGLNPAFGTRTTLTKVRTETTDTDASAISMFGTQTITEVRAESTDKD